MQIRLYLNMSGSELSSRWLRKPRYEAQVTDREKLAFQLRLNHFL